ncbi:pupal cuticle protein PCP52-like [Battus philenor]|uniref:pupal cuticle protein PCP52-like n=1 Tax=Battus philenor TaxID=42288 RepID=UPI0035CE88A6
MRVLILSATVLACATAAPSGAFFAQIAPYAYSALAIPAVVPTISPGDLQAAAIDAKVQVEDFARAAADKARELAEQAVEKQDEGVVEANDLAKERAEENFWAAEEKKWQAMDALKTAEAQVDGSIASTADAVVKAAYAVPSAVVVQPGLVQNVGAAVAETKSAPVMEAKAEEQKEKEKVEGEASAAVKSAEAESKPVENAEKAADSVQVDAAKMESVADVKSTDVAKQEGPGFLALSQTHPLPLGSAALVAQPWLNAAIAPVSYVHGLRTYSLIPSAPLLNHAYYKAAW